MVILSVTQSRGVLVCTNVVTSWKLAFVDGGIVCRTISRSVRVYYACIHVKLDIV